MKNLKKALPLAALLLGITAYGVQATIAKVSTTTDQQWRLNENGSPTNPEDYTSAPEVDRDHCQGIDQVCLVIAPDDGTGNPKFSDVPGLEQALNTNLNHNNIVKAPYTP